MKQQLVAVTMVVLWVLVGCTPTETERVSQEDEASPDPKTAAAQEKTGLQKKTDPQGKTAAQKQAKTSPKATAKSAAAPESEEEGDYDATVTVTRVVDGDTVDVSPTVDGVSRVRLIGVDAPETRECPGGQPLSQEAKAYTTSELQGQTVDLELDEEKTDQYGRLLAYVYEDEEMFNEDLLEVGYAQVATFPPNVRYVDRFLAAQGEARAAGLGIWGLSEEELATQTERGNGIGGGGCAPGETTTLPKIPPPPPEPTPDPDPDRDAVPGADAPRVTPRPSPRPAPTPPKQKAAPPPKQEAVPSPKAGGDLDCGNFSSRAEAQPYLLPGDPHGLDRDGDGQACDSLP